MPRSKKYTKQELKSMLLEMNLEHEGTPSLRAFRDFYNIGQNTIYNYFDSWNDFIEFCNLERNNPRYSNQELKEELLRVSKEEFGGRSFTSRDFNKYSDINDHTIALRFGSWNEALLSVGLEPIQAHGITREEIINEIKRISEKYCSERKAPKIKKFDKYGKYSVNTVAEKFGTYYEGLIEAGFEDLDSPVSQVDQSRLIEEIQRVSDEYCNGDRPSKVEMNKYAEYTPVTCHNKFGSWNNAIEEAGFEVYQHPSGKDSPSWKGGYSEYYGPSWRNQQRKAWDRDDFKCRVCDKKTENRPDVHHIDPVRNWNVEEEHELMNSLNNIVCLCKSCHGKYGGKKTELETDEWVKEFKND